MANPSKKPIVIVGAGWAGLTAGLRLAQENKSVVILESGLGPGGRARGVCFDTEILDNGQHLLLGGYQQVLAQLKFLGINETEVLQRRSFHLVMHRQRQISANKTIDSSFNLKFFSTWPQCLSPIFSLFTAGLSGLSINERLALGYFFKILPNISQKTLGNFTIAEMLTQFKQPNSLIQHFWNPVSHAALSTPPNRASASIFINVLQQAFTTNPSYADLLFPKVDLTQMFPGPACDYLEKAGHQLCFREPALALIFENDRCVGVKTKNKIWRADNIILALPPYAVLKLLPSLVQFFPLKQQLLAFDYHPITTVYLDFKSLELPKFKSPLLGFTQGVVQWVFDLSSIKQRSLLSVVITGKGQHSDWTREKLLETILSELRCYYPSLPSPVASQIITEKRAAFCCNPDIIQKRPSTKTSIPGLYLAGDYVDSGFPASLEAAVQSGITAAELVL